MTITRRDAIIKGSAAALWTAALTNSRAPAQQRSRSAAVPSGDGIDSVAFWNQFFHPPALSEGTVRGGSSQGKAQPATPGSQVEYVQLGPDGLRYVQDIKPEELTNIGGDVMVSVSPAQFRFGSRSTGNASEYLHSAQLRFDIHQSQRFLNVLPLLAWTSLAAIFPDKSGKLPSIQQLDFTSSEGESAVDKVLLPGGMGTIAVNLSTAKKASTLYTVLQGIAKESRVLMPVLGLPAISVIALEAFTALYAQIEQHTTFLLSSGPTNIVVTQDAWNSADRPAQVAAFVSGDYLLYPKEQADIIRPHFGSLTIENGYVVDTDADKSLLITERADRAVAGLTYVTMRLSVSPANLSPASKKSSDQQPGGDAGKKPNKKTK
jgi:hypothetical protein